MAILFVVCGLGLVVLLIVAAGAKWRDSAGSGAAMRAFGLPEGLARQAAPLLPAAELGLAALLLAPYGTWLGAVLATLLFGLSGAMIAVALLRGKHPSCNCFGQAQPTPVSWNTVLRNVLLMLAAATLLWTGAGRLQHGLLLESIDLAGAWPLMLLASALQFWLLNQLIQQQGRLLLKIDNLEQQAGLTSFEPPAPGPGPGQAAPDFSAVSLGGRRLSLNDLLRDGKNLTLLFVSPDCPPCQQLLAELLTRRQAGPPGDKLLLISSGTRLANEGKLAALAGETVLLQEGMEINALFGVLATPSALLIRRDGRIGSPLAVGRDAILALLHPASGAPAGQQQLSASLP